MAQDPNNRADPHKAIESFATEMNLSVGEVRALYEVVVAELAAKAKIDTYLHVFAIRDLKEKLHARGERHH